MMQRAQIPSIAGTRLETSATSTGNYPLLVKGNVAPANGNVLPAEVPENVDLKSLARKLNIAARTIGNELRFEVDLDNGPAVIKVLDRETGEVVRQIPSDKALDVLRDNSMQRIRLIDALV